MESGEPLPEPNKYLPIRDDNINERESKYLTLPPQITDEELDEQMHQVGSPKTGVLEDKMAERGAIYLSQDEENKIMEPETKASGFSSNEENPSPDKLSNEPPVCGEVWIGELISENKPIPDGHSLEYERKSKETLEALDSSDNVLDEENPVSQIDLKMSPKAKSGTQKLKRPTNKLFIFRKDYLNKLRLNNEPKPAHLNITKLSELFSKLEPAEKELYEKKYQESLDQYKENVKNAGPILRRRKQASNTTHSKRNGDSSVSLIDSVISKIEKSKKRLKNIENSKGEVEKNESPIVESSQGDSEKNFQGHRDIYLSALKKNLLKMKKENPIVFPLKPEESGHVYIMRISLKGIKPPIYRILLIPGNFSLRDFHLLIQLAFGWKNYHLHEFILKNIELNKEDCSFEYDEKKEREYRLDDLSLKVKDTFMYVYDFGNNWEHSVRVVSKIKATENKQENIPSLVDGRRACPPEDIGGPIEYSNLISGRRETGEWAGEFSEHLEGSYEGEFDPDFFDHNHGKLMVSLWEYYSNYLNNL